MRYVLNGGTKRINDEELKELSPLFDELDIGCILYLEFASKHDGFTRQWYESSDKKLHDRSTKLVTFNSLDIPAIKSAEAIFLLGGSPTLLMERLKTTGMDEILKKSQNLRLLIGQSAGAMVMGSQFINGKKEMSLHDGLGLMQNLIVDVHFSQRQRHRRLQSAWVQLPDSVQAIGIDEATSAVYANGRLQAVQGKGSVYLITSDGMKKYDSSK